MPGVTHWHHQNFYAYFPTGELWFLIMTNKGGLLT